MPGANDWTTLPVAKGYLRIKSGDDDTLLGLLITSASTLLQNELGRAIVTANFVDTIDGNDRHTLTLANAPVTAVSAVTVDGTPVPARTSPTGAGFVFTDNAVKLSGYAFNKGVQNCVIAYTAGYATVPADLQLCCWGLVDLLYHEHDRAGLESRTIGQETSRYLTKDAWPKWITDILDNNRRNVLLA